MPTKRTAEMRVSSSIFGDDGKSHILPNSKGQPIFKNAKETAVIFNALNGV